MLHSKHGKTIKLFLMDSDPDGRIICELSNWTGKAYRIPRGKIKDCANRPELRSTAVYLLFGKPEFSAAKPKVYIGEAENVYKRLGEHVSEKEFWNESVVFISKDENLNKAHIKYIESRLHEIASSAGRHELQNNNTPTRSSISEADQAEMEEFIEYIKMLINTLGFKVFEPLVKEATVESPATDTLYIKAARGANGMGKRVPDGFVVLKGTEIAGDTVPSLRKTYVALRDELLETGIIEDQQGKLTFTSDYLFSSPSSAAAVIMGRSSNGLVEWKDGSKRDLKSIEESEIRNSEQAAQS